MVAAKETIIIHKGDLTKYPYTKDLFELKGPSSLYQTYSGVYNFETITKIIDGYKPVRIVVYCNEMHASTIVKIIVTLQMRKYLLRIHRVIINDDKRMVRTIVLRFWSLGLSNLYTN